MAKKNEITSKQLQKKLGAFKRVYQVEHCNQYEIAFENGSVFQSYGSLIGAKINGVLYLSDYHKFSTTTSKHTTLWCGYNRKERDKMLKEGTAIRIATAEMF